MRTITISEEQFDNLFDRIEKNFCYDHLYMDRNETSEEFEKTITCSLLHKIRSEIKILKNDLMRLE